MTDEERNRAQMVVWGLETRPLAITMTIMGEGVYRLPLRPAAAQTLALALLAQPEVGYTMLPEVGESIMETAAECAARDDKFLESMGVKL
jgi:hypothetical protein